MPYLDLGDQRDPFDMHDRLFAVMLFPDDEDRRRQYLRFWSFIRQALDAGEDDLCRALGPSARAFHEDGLPLLRGQQAGYVLAMLRAMTERHSIEPSLNKAYNILARSAAPGLRTGNGKAVPATERSYREAFSKYRSVAHLWAAWALLLWYCKTILNQEPIYLKLDVAKQQAILEIHSQESLLELLALAEDMRRFGEGHTLFDKSQGGIRTPILNSQITWKAPKGVALPDSSVCVPAFPDDVLGWLSEYKANSRS